MDCRRCSGRVIQADCSGGDLGNDGGLLLLRQFDRHRALSRAAVAAVSDPQNPERVHDSLHGAVGAASVRPVLRLRRVGLLLLCLIDLHPSGRCGAGT
jgi:hypothetical protein